MVESGRPSVDASAASAASGAEPAEARSATRPYESSRSFLPTVFWSQRLGQAGLAIISDLEGVLTYARLAV
jgi:hypothetical protein